MKTSTKIIIAVVVIVVAVLIWGLVGSSEAAKIGTTCDFGIGEDGSVLCWKWHRNAWGQTGDAINSWLEGK
ncbi:MAG TPA: hypothetical protein PLT60_03385 [Candidatus Pacearchaeota archaeon]|jgi:hypothetical protein|nr:hypothetical protein [Candidatus Pacearchaeota archaeon]HNZ52459.1 hypothetical protein [Candidatus Pacearchaeota archaeon]HOF44482.1 hypothetical protein [Candidatus Pacearchaeota archaeon]HOH04468.1 hypothetical protein [Candidatus Pacearchaeota archaeon]HOR52414.1 hypothetical protein [Candidatus Pacearchaeota archaeon]